MGGLVGKQQVHPDQQPRAQTEEKQGDPIPSFAPIPMEKAVIGHAEAHRRRQSAPRIGPPERSRKKEEKGQKEDRHRQPSAHRASLQPGGAGQDGRTEDNPIYSFPIP